MDVTGLADPYVKIYLLYNGKYRSSQQEKSSTLLPANLVGIPFQFRILSECNSRPTDRQEEDPREKENPQSRLQRELRF